MTEAKQMRMLFIGGGSRFWGMEQSMLTLETTLQKRGVQCAHITSEWSDGVLANKLTQSGIINWSIKLGRLYLTRPRWTFATVKALPRATMQLRKSVRSFKPHVILHQHNRLFFLTYPMLLGLECHHVYCEHVTPSENWVDTLSYRVIFATCSCVIVHSVDNQRLFHELNPRRRLPIVVGHGIDCDVLKPENRCSGSTIYIGIVGRIVEGKGHDVLLTSLALLKQRQLDVCLVIIGDGDEHFVNRLKSQIADRGLGESVRWMSVTYDKSMIYRHFDILAVPSRREAFGLVAAEAGAAGLPVVASRVGGLQHVLADGETGILVQPEDPFELAGALERLIVNPALRNAMGMAGRRRIETRFSTDRMADEFVQAIQSAISP